MKSLHKDNNGFTLIELLVSLSLFIIVVLALVSALYNINNASRKVQAMRSVIDNLNFSLESMSRTIRTGSHIVCGGSTTAVWNTWDSTTTGHNCPIASNTMTNAATQIRVDSTVGNARSVEYRFHEHAIERCIKEEKTEACGIGDWIPITAAEITIEKLNFYVDGADLSDGKQPSVILMVEGVAHAGSGNDLPFSVQTYLSQRVVE